jgi:hypothetical protein
MIGREWISFEHGFIDVLDQLPLLFDLNSFGYWPPTDLNCLSSGCASASIGTTSPFLARATSSLAKNKLVMDIYL